MKAFDVNFFPARECSFFITRSEREKRNYGDSMTGEPDPTECDDFSYPSRGVRTARGLCWRLLFPSPPPNRDHGNSNDLSVGYDPTGSNRCMAFVRPLAFAHRRHDDSMVCAGTRVHALCAPEHTSRQSSIGAIAVYDSSDLFHGQQHGLTDLSYDEH